MARIHTLYLKYIHPQYFSGYHISLHASGRWHNRFNLPISCLSQGPKFTQPIDKQLMLSHINCTKNTLFEPLGQIKSDSGFICVLKVKDLLSKYLIDHSCKMQADYKLKNYYRKLYESSGKIDNKENPYPYTKFKIHRYQEFLNDSLRFYNSQNISKNIQLLKNTGKIESTDIVAYASSNDEFPTFLIGENRIRNLDFNNPINLLNQLPGGIAYQGFYNKLEEII